MWESALWGLLGGSTLVIGALIGIKAHWSSRVIGLIMAFGAGVLFARLIMAFGAGVLFASVAYELVEDAAHVGSFSAVASGLVVGSLTFFVGDVLIARAGAKDRKSSGGSAGSSAGSTAEASGAALALGALLDGIPGSAAIGVTILQGGAPSTAFIAAVALSNLPE